METTKETRSAQQKKRLLMNAISTILKANKRTIEIIKDSTLNNLKLIERSSKCTKDPNPLASTLVQMNTKYPISIHKEMAIKYKIPRSMMPIVGPGDTHKHDRVRCKKDAVEWWIGNSELPDEELSKTIDIIRKQTRKDVEGY